LGGNLSLFINSEKYPKREKRALKRVVEENDLEKRYFCQNFSI
jgi:hypothetical protein